MPIKTAQGKWDKELRDKSKNDLVRLVKQEIWDRMVIAKLARVVCIELYRRCPEHTVFNDKVSLTEESLIVVRREAHKAGMLTNNTKDDGR
jgi:hypothetical protein